MSSTKLALKFLGHFNGADGATSFVDDSSYSRTIENNSIRACALSTGITKFGTSSLGITYTVKVTESGTTTTNIKITGHGLQLGDQIMIEGIYVSPNKFLATVNTIVDVDNFTIVEDISDSSITSGISIYYHQYKKVSISANSSDILLKDYFTIRFWFRHDGNYNGAILGLDQTGYATTESYPFTLFNFDQSTDKITAGSLTSTSILSANTWYFIEWSVNPYDQYLFIDGSLDTSGSLTNPIDYDTFDLIGIFSKAFVFSGSCYIDDLQIWQDACLHTSSYTAPTAEYSDASNILLVSETLDVEFTQKQVKIVSETLDVEFTQKQARISSLNLDTEVKIPNVKMASVSIQVEVVIPVATSRLKYWDGAAWTAKTLKRYESGTWTEHPLKFYNGVTWES